MKRNTLFFLLGLLFLVPISLHAYDFKSGDLYYNITSNTEPYTVEVTYEIEDSWSNYSNLTVVVIPETVTYNGTTYEVTSIGDGAFCGCTGLTSITIPKSVTSISVRSIDHTAGGNSAFLGCSGLTSIVIESGNSVYDSRNNCNAIIETATNTLIAGCKNTIIPNSVTSIGGYAFAFCDITSMTIPNSVTSIGDDAFFRCENLTSIVIPENVTSIGMSAFMGCISLVSIIIPEGETSIGPYAFRDTPWYNNQPDGVLYINKSLYTYKGDMPANTSIIVKDGTVSINSCAFIRCKDLTSITIPNSVTSIGSSAFNGCTGLTSINIPNSVTSIGGWAFDGCSITSVTIPESVASIGEYVFQNCSNLTSVVWNAINCVITTEGYSYSGPFHNIESQITSFTFGNEVETIPARLCSDMTALTSVTIPNSVRNIGQSAFDNVQNIVYTGTATGSPWGAKNVNGYVEGYLVYESVAKTQLLGCSVAATGEIIIPESVRSIRGGAFQDCTGLTSITIPESVTSIGRYAFYGCTGLTSITIPEGVTSIGYKACYNVLNIAYTGTATGSPWGAKSINGYVEGDLVYKDAAKTQLLGCRLATTGEIIIPESVRSIGKGAFQDCSKLTSIVIPEGVTKIENRAFAYCWDLASIIIPDGITDIADSTFYHCAHLKSITIPNSVTTIGENAFVYCIFLTSVTIPNGVTKIGSKAFSECHDLTSITIPESVTSIGVDAFKYCSRLTSVTWNAKHCGDFYMDASNNKSTSPFYDIASQITSFRFGNEVEYIPAYLCYGMNKLTSVTIPESVANIGDSVFYACTGLTSVTWNAKHCGDSYMDSSNNKSTSPFYDIASQITSFTFGNRVEYIPAYLCYGMAGISSITILNNATGIGEYAFANLGKLTELHLGTKLESIGANAFAGCRRLYNIYCYAALPPLAEETSFANYNSRVCVPCDVLSNYKYDAVWGNFRNIDCIGSEEVNVPTNSVTVIPTTNDATFTWPSNGNANAYTLVITKDGVVFCTLTFNANGQLTGIAFAPSRDRNNAHAPQAALATANGWQFTVTGLNESSNYAYTMTVTDSRDKVLKSYEGTFSTLSSDLPEDLTQTSEAATGIQKIIRNGQVLIQRDGQIYNLFGKQIQ